MDIVKTLFLMVYPYREFISFILFFLSIYQLFKISKNLNGNQPLLTIKNTWTIISVYLKTAIACFAVGLPDLEYIIRFLTIGCLIGLPLIDLLKIKHGKLDF